MDEQELLALKPELQRFLDRFAPQGLRITARLNYCQMLVRVKGAALPFSWSRLGCKEVTHGYSRSFRLPLLPAAA
jgi:hypothetical protein